MATTRQGSMADVGGEQRPAVVITENDIVFNCPACSGELVVDRLGAGMTCDCLHCGHSLIVPEHRPVPPPEGIRLNVPPAANASPAPGDAVGAASPGHFDFSSYSAEQLERRFNELKNQLKENQSQDTEMRGHVNRATMELHRLQLKLKKLQERQGDIEAELAALRTQAESRVS